MSHVFISHVTKDSRIAARIKDRLNEAGISTWMANTDLKLGDNWQTSIEQALKNAFAMVLVLSPAALNSPSVVSEYSYFLGQNKRLIPVLADSIPIEDFPLSLSRLQYIDLADDFDQGIRTLTSEVNSNGKKRKRPSR